MLPLTWSPFYSFTAELETREVPSNETVFKQAFFFFPSLPHLLWQESLMAVNKTNLKTLHIGTAAPLSLFMGACTYDVHKAYGVLGFLPPTSWPKQSHKLPLFWRKTLFSPAADVIQA